MDYYEIGQRIRAVRKAHGLSQETLAEKVGISTTHMSHIETGNTKLSLPVLVALSSALNTNIDDLLRKHAYPKRSTSIESIVSLLETCTPHQLKIIEDIIRATKVSLERHL